MVLALGGTLVVTAVAAVIPLIQRQIVDDLGGPGHLAGPSVLLGAALASFGGLYLRRYRGGQVSLDVQHDLRTEMLGLCPGWTGRARTSCTPARSSAAPFLTCPWSRPCSA